MILIEIKPIEKAEAFINPEAIRFIFKETTGECYVELERGYFKITEECFDELKRDLRQK